jgi:hypothetical protein
MNQLPTIRLKTRVITFDDRLQQVRIVRMSSPSKRSARSFAGYWPVGKIRFLDYKSDDGFRYLKKYRKDWSKAIQL